MPVKFQGKVRKLFKVLLFDNGSVLTVFDRQFGIMQPPGSPPTSEMGCNLERWQLLRPLYWRATGIKTGKKISKQFRLISENLVKMFWYRTILCIERVFSSNARSQILILKWGQVFPLPFVCDKTQILLPTGFWVVLQAGCEYTCPFCVLDEIRATWVLVTATCFRPCEDRALNHCSPQTFSSNTNCSLRSRIWSLRLFWKKKKLIPITPLILRVKCFLKSCVT